MNSSSQCPADKPDITIHLRFQIGNITLVSDDNWGFKVADYHLKSRGEVFRNMLDSCSPESEIRIPDTDKATLELFVRGMTDKLEVSTWTRRINWDWALSSEALKLCAVYDCPGVAHSILGAVVKNGLKAEELRPAFLAAAEHDDLLSAFYILLQGQHWDETTDTKSEVEDGDSDDEFERVKIKTIVVTRPPYMWTTEEQENVPNTWKFALQYASVQLEGRRGNSNGEAGGYWRHLAHLFMQIVKDGGVM